MQYLINSRGYTYFQPLVAELNDTPQKNYLFDLDYLTILMVDGERAQEFLQGQLSCDVREVTSTQMQQGVMCDLKGRILSILDVIFWSRRSFCLVLPNDLCAATQQSLLRAAQLSRITLTVDASVQVFGFMRQSSEDIRPFDKRLPQNRYELSSESTFCCYPIDDNFYMLIVQKDKADSVKAPFIEHGQFRGSLDWHALQLQHHRAEIYPESRGMFTPHRLNMQNLGYLNFEKGCYKGQEIVARTHYRATLKHQLKHLKIQTNVELRLGMSLYAEDGVTEIAELIDYCPIGDNQYIILMSVLLKYKGVILPILANLL